MLVLARKLGEQIVVPQCGLTITISAINGSTVRLAFSAPPEIEVYREEVWRRCSRQRSSDPAGLLASDIYSLGATLYTLVKGRPPMEGQDTAEVLCKARAFLDGIELLRLHQRHQGIGVAAHTVLGDT
jgi:carbon storage regulator CsrA